MLRMTLTGYIPLQAAGQIEAGHFMFVYNPVKTGFFLGTIPHPRKVRPIITEKGISFKYACLTSQKRRPGGLGNDFSKAHTGTNDGYDRTRLLVICFAIGPFHAKAFGAILRRASRH